MTPLLALVLATSLKDQTSVRDAILKQGLTDLGAYTMLSELCTTVGGRLSGSANAAKAVEWTKEKMQRNGLLGVREIPCMVPHWVRGDTSSATLITPSGSTTLSACALGMSPGTPAEGILTDVVEVHSLEEVAKLGSAVKGKIVFYNRPFEQTLPTTFAMYGKAGDQRFAGPATAAKFGAVGALVRSMTSLDDDAPHTGTTVFPEGQPKIPAAALGLHSADLLSQAIKAGSAQVKMQFNCQTLPDEPSASVIGEIRGSERPDEVIVIGGHLDSWDLAQGAHDDGAGVAQALEALRIIKALGLKPKRTIRAIAWMNEENGGRGAKSYAEWVNKSGQKPYASLESDSGGFMPRALGATAPDMKKVGSWQPLLEIFGVDRVKPGGGEADNSPLAEQKSALFGVEPDNARYFDYHHSRTDTIDKVNPRELEFGAMAEATLAWLISEEGL